MARHARKVFSHPFPGCVTEGGLSLSGFMHLAAQILKGLAILWAVLFVAGCVIAAFTARTIFQNRKVQTRRPGAGGAEIIDFPPAPRKQTDKAASSR